MVAIAASTAGLRMMDNENMAPALTTAATTFPGAVRGVAAYEDPRGLRADRFGGVDRLGEHARRTLG
jgi:hypothetical protein